MTTRAVLSLFVSLGSVWGFTTSARDYPFVAVPQSQVDITDTFWAPTIEINRTASIQHNPFGFTSSLALRTSSRI